MAAKSPWDKAGLRRSRAASIWVTCASIVERCVSSWRTGSFTRSLKSHSFRIVKDEGVRGFRIDDIGGLLSVEVKLNRILPDGHAQKNSVSAEIPRRPSV